MCQNCNFGWYEYSLFLKLQYRIRIPIYMLRCSWIPLQRSWSSICRPVDRLSLLTSSSLHWLPGSLCLALSAVSVVRITAAMSHWSGSHFPLYALWVSVCCVKSMVARSGSSCQEWKGVLARGEGSALLAPLTFGMITECKIKLHSLSQCFAGSTCGSSIIRIWISDCS